MTKESSNRLAEARLMAGLSTRQAAQLLGMDSGQIDAIEKAAAPPPAAELDRFADLYGVSSAWLTGARPAPPSVAAFRGAERLKTEDRDRITEVLGSMALPLREGR